MNKRMQNNQGKENKPNYDEKLGEYEIDKVKFTKEMKENGYTILVPQMAPIHFELLLPALEAEGYNVKLLRDCTEHTIETGLTICK